MLIINNYNFLYFFKDDNVELKGEFVFEDSNQIINFNEYYEYNEKIKYIPKLNTFYYSDKIYFLISLKSVDEWNTNYAEPGSNKVHLFGKTGLSSIYHEFMHIIFGDCQIPWASEANAMYWPTYVDLDYYKDSLDRFYNNLGENINIEYEKAIAAADIKERLGIEAEYQIVQKWNEIYEKNLEIS